MNRLYVLESRYTVTGGMADHRLRVHSSQMMKAAVAIAREVASLTGDDTLKKAAEAVKLTGDYQPRSDYDAWVKETAKDLVASKGGKALVIVGAAQPMEVHLLGLALNQALGAMMKAAGKNHPPLELKQATLLPAGTIEQLAQAVKSEEVKTLFILGQCDPCYDAPYDLSWPEVQKKIRTVFHLSTRHRTATARASRWHIPGTHFLEQWGDVRGLSGTYSVIQPMIMPLYGGISDIELISWLGQETPLTAPAPEAAPAAAPANGATPEAATDPLFLAVKETFGTLVKENIDDAWSQALKEGFVAKTEWPEATASVKNNALVTALSLFVDTPAPTAHLMELTLVADSKVFDGRYINNAWLQESPDPITKLVWDNAALVSVRTAHELGLDRKAIYNDQAQTIELAVGSQTLTVPVLIAPGHADHAITLALGYGQPGAGKNGPGRVGEDTGKNAYIFRTTHHPYFIPGAKVALTGQTMPIAVTQEHATMYGRELVREATAERFKAEPNFAYSEGSDSHIPQDFSFYKQVGKVRHRDGFSTPLLADTQHQWGMVIDLNACIGCNSCAIACQSENNIPVVGKRQVMIGREMSWIRMDRYFAIDLDGKKNADGKEYEINEAQDAGREREVDDPELLFQPVSCQHCEAAPCENVCPVNATVHSEDGLNLMVYNRCIGTRYCANNCPYKARRFNFFDYNKYDPLLNADGGRDNAQTNTGLFDLLHQNNLYKGAAGQRGDYESLKLQKNPNVTVRMRGVIEKCTYCIQRIEEAKINQRGKITKLKSTQTGIVDEKLTLSDEELRIPTDGVKTACQQACPADGIVFGNLLDKNGALAKLQNHPRRYQLLRYVGALPRTSYLARIKNPNPALIAASAIEKRKVGQATANI
jgi:molybdopterin-containing oxidoreductase family iron-sulfur binding subunit